jgi:hypothetical protein
MNPRVHNALNGAKFGAKVGVLIALLVMAVVLIIIGRHKGVRNHFFRFLTPFLSRKRWR